MRSASTVVVFVLALVAPVYAQEALPDGGTTTAAPEPPPPRRLVVTVVTRSDSGRVFCAVWRGRRGYPTERRFAVGQTLDRTIVRHRAQCVFSGLVPNGEYAVAAFHDENANNDLDRGIFGIPTEGTGASNDARGFMAPPPYDGARFRFPDVVEHRIRIRIGYM